MSEEQILDITIAEVEWLDAGLETAQLSQADVERQTAMPRKNTGYLLVNNDEKVVLCFGVINDRETHGEMWDVTMVIPKGTVTSVRILS